MAKLKKGDKVETVHGEKLEVLEVKEELLKKNGVSTGETMEFFLAESGDNNVWIPASKVKGK